MSYNGETKVFLKSDDVVPFSKGNITFFNNPFIEIYDDNCQSLNFNNSFWSFDYLKSIYGFKKIKLDIMSSQEDLFTQINEKDFLKYVYVGYDLWAKPESFGLDINSYYFNTLQMEVLNKWENCSFENEDIIHTPTRTLLNTEIEVITFKEVGYENTCCRIDRYNFRKNYPKTYIIDSDLAFITQEDDYNNWRQIKDFNEESLLPDFIEKQHIAILKY